ncbi:hypothetical protein AB433_05790 [Croceicoccus naphthovorans]|uniref:XdhC Rossmann domain-containing protein n=1 Tax=Croceicoccus naphthovorans TaxID=1348774 RepID=A0A0G3XM87_9SPHN|nr:hypothetical protein AB433_05790 [Croceicoccus naphthovorans]
MAIRPDGTVVGSLSDGCLEQQLVADVAAASGPSVRRYGKGSALIDFRLPCGGGLDILIDPSPDRAACRDTVALLDCREPAGLALPENIYLPTRRYLPALRIHAFGVDPELSALDRLALVMNVPMVCMRPESLSLGQAPDMASPDRWTATILLFHDHEWEGAILHHALRGGSFYVGAQGGAKAREDRLSRLRAAGVAEEDLARIRGPVGVTPSARTPNALALSVLSEIVFEYDRIHPHF